MKTLLCCIGRNENRYVREYVKYYKDLGFTNICLYDNNRDGEEHFEEAIGDYISDGFVMLQDYRNRTACQRQAYADCYNRFGKEYDWIAFFDLDEYLAFTKYADISEFLSDKRLEGFDMIHVNWMLYGDNGLVRMDSRPLTERFTEPLPADRRLGYKFPENNHIKTMIRGGAVDSISWEMTPHTPAELKLRCCNPSGVEVASDSPFAPYDHSTAYLKHYSYMTAEEYAIKMRRGFPDEVWDTKRISRMVRRQFFRANEPTQEKVDLFREMLGVDMSRLLKKKSLLYRIFRHR